MVEGRNSQQSTAAGPARPGRRHMVAFGALLALLLLVARGRPVDQEAAHRVVLTEADLAQVRATFERTWGRPPTEEELRRAFARYVRDEVLYRDALARGLDLDDPVVRMSMIRKITLLGTSQAAAVDPTDQEMAAFFELRRERYRQPGTLSLYQVCLSPAGAEAARQDAVQRTLSTLRERDPGPDELAELSDISMLPISVTGQSEERLDSTFGAEFVSAVATLPVGEWAGPIQSGFGIHLVKVLHREPSRVPAWQEVADRIRADMRYQAQKAAEDQLYAEIAPRYRVVLDAGASAALGEATP
jgi:hypothetical protein